MSSLEAGARSRLSPAPCRGNTPMAERSTETAPSSRSIAALEQGSQMPLRHRDDQNDGGIRAGTTRRPPLPAHGQRRGGETMTQSALLGLT